jgi:hypothetical protein
MRIYIALAKIENHGMKKADDILRIKKLNELIKLEGSIANLCRNRISGKADKPVDPSHISQIRTGKRTFGEKAARSMEERLGLPHMYFDTASIWIASDNAEPTRLVLTRDGINWKLTNITGPSIHQAAK